MMKKLAVLVVAACTAVLSVGQPALADWQPFVHTAKGIPVYYDENFTYPAQINPKVITARLMEQGHAPFYLIFSCFSTHGAVSQETNVSEDSRTLVYTNISIADTNKTVNSTFRARYCQGQVDRNLAIMDKINSNQQRTNSWIQHLPGSPGH